MKDIKSIMIGFLTATCMFLFMGQRMSDSQGGKYPYNFELHQFGEGREATLLNTKTGALWYVLSNADDNYRWIKEIKEKK